MANTRQPTMYVVGAIVVAIVAFFVAAPAESRSPTCNDSLRDSAKRMRELEAELRALREQVRAAADCTSNAPPQQARPTPSRSLAAASSPNAHGQRTANGERTDICDPPFNFDRRGIKFYNPECLGPEESPCATPYGYTSSGIKYYEPGCLAVSAARASCDPAFEVDAHGVKQYKAECL